MPDEVETTVAESSSNETIQNCSELVDDCCLFSGIAPNTKVTVYSGTFQSKPFDLLATDHSPASTSCPYRTFAYTNPQSKRKVKVWKCDHLSCVSRDDASTRFFKKAHNFNDHLRIHTGERPFVCEVPDCGQAFTQRANYNKHMEVHENNPRFVCEVDGCGKKFFTSFNAKVRYLIAS